MSANDASDRSEDDNGSSKDDEAAGDEIVISADEAHDGDSQDNTESSSEDHNATDPTAPGDTDGDGSETSRAETTPEDGEMVISAAEASDVNSGDNGPSAVLRYIKPVLYVLILAAALGGGYVAVQSQGGVPDVLPMGDNASDAAPGENGSNTGGDSTPDGDTSAPPEPSEPVFDADELAATVMTDINAYRDRHEVAALFRDPALEAIAQNYSAYLAANDYVNRIDLEGQKPKTWIAAAGYDCAQQGETFLYDGDALVESEDFRRDGTNLSSAQLSSDVVGQWRGEGRASEVLRQPYWDDAGIGAVLNGDEVIVTAVLC